MKRYKLRVYVTSGPDKGNLDHEEFFDSIEELDKRYNELFDYKLFSLILLLGFGTETIIEELVDINGGTCNVRIS